MVFCSTLLSGRRWNVEKNQVDSVPFKVDRLFLGTMCFTILLFLLPTTAMYYVVFTVLRLVVLFVKGVISRAIDAMNNLPVFPLMTACVRPDLIPGTFLLLNSKVFRELYGSSGWEPWEKKAKNQRKVSNQISREILEISRLFYKAKMF